VLEKEELTVTNVISYRKAAIADKDAIWRVRSASIRGLCKGHYGEELAERWASVRPPADFADVICERKFIVAEYGGVIVGFGFLADQMGTLEGLSVEPHFARRGVGTAIADLLEACARCAGVRSLTLSASLNAVPFYKTRGYREIRETTWHHPAGFSLPCVAMTKDL